MMMMMMMMMMVMVMMITSRSLIASSCGIQLTWCHTLGGSAWKSLGSVVLQAKAVEVEGAWDAEGAERDGGIGGAGDAW